MATVAIVLTAAGLYVAWALIPHGLNLAPVVSNSAGVSEQTASAIVEELAAGGLILSDEDRGRIYRDTLWRPWVRRQYSSHVSIRRDEEQIRVESTMRKETSEVVVHSLLRQTSEGVRLEHVHNVISK